MLKINPYLNFDGKAEEAFNFYKSVFGGEFAGGINRFKDMPESDDYQVSKDEKERVMHVALPVGDQVLMASDISPSRGHKLVVGNNNYISLHPDNLEDAQRIFKELSEGGEIEMALQKMFWGDYFASFKDRFGVTWMINYHEENQ